MPVPAVRRAFVFAVAAVAFAAAVTASAAAWSRPDVLRTSLATAAEPVGPAGSWSLVFADEFDGASLDGARWHTCFWWATTTCSIESNGELEVYTADEVSLAGGAAHLRAERRDRVAWNGTTYHYTSGMVMTGGRKGVKPPGFTFTYGYAEARVRVPRGKGLWPAFWLLPASYTSRPEIDVMEILGDSTDVQHMNFHYVRRDGTRGDAGLAWRGPDFSTGWHTFGVDWRPDALVWYVDGVERWRFSDTSVIPSQPMYLLANLAVGGTWPGSPDASTVFPSTYDVDYVRVWKSIGASAAATTLVPSAATWRYRDDGRDAGTAWRGGTAFDDGTWKTGSAILGYGQGNESSVVSYGSDPSNKYVTTYFRRTFSIADPAAFGALTLNLRRDDGAIVYLNGAEVYRSNMPTGAVGALTYAREALDDGNQAFTASISPSLLRAGANVVAVEVHQATRSSSDLTMQLSLVATPR
jgi:beta-glucanase (GH16 family)